MNIHVWQKYEHEYEHKQEHEVLQEQNISVSLKFTCIWLSFKSNSYRNWLTQRKSLFLGWVHSLSVKPFTTGDQYSTV